VGAAPVIALFTLVLLALLFVPGLGETHKGAQRWLRLGPIGIQPTEFARVGAIVLVARLLSRRPEVMARFQTGPLPALVVAAAFVLLILPQPSLGCTVALLLTVGSMCFVAGLRWKHLGGLVVAGLVAVPLLLGAVAETRGHRRLAPAHNYQAGRISSFVAMWQGKDDPLGPTYQLRQSILAIGSGGLTGKGIGGSEQKWLFLPDAHTDFIFSIMGEEMGFLGACFLFLLFGIFIWRGLSIAAEADDRFGFMLAAGLTVNFGVYILINLAVTMGLMPTTGLPLPFVSYGGSALLANLAAVGLLLSVSRHRKSGIVLTNRSGRLR
jgi:cell division protein FtsW